MFWCRFNQACAYLAVALAGAAGLWFLAVNLSDQLTRLRGAPDPACTAGYCDFGMFWVAGRLAQTGHAAWAYDFSRYAQAAAGLLPGQSGFWPFVYPPFMLPFARLAALRGLAPDYLLWATVMTVTSACLLCRAGLRRRYILLGLLSPASLWNLYLGQFGLLCGALLVCGLAGLGSAPCRAGVALGLLAIKPQYALLAPVCALAGRQWRAMAAGMHTLAALLALSLWAGGTAAWAAYLGPGRAMMAALLNQNFAPGYQIMGVSIFWSARSFGLSLAAAYMVQALVSLSAALAAWRLWRGNNADPLGRITITICLTLLASPYGFTDDFAVLGALIPRLGSTATPWRNAALAVLWAAPAFAPKLTAHTGILATPLITLCVLALACTSRLAEEKQPLLAE